MAKINCEDRNPRNKVDLSNIKKIAAKTLKSLKKGRAEVNIVFVTNPEIRAMNRRYLGADRATDVLAFDGVCEGVFGMKNFLGDIVISTDQVLKNAKEFGTEFRGETALCVIHGILHLLGYRDGTKGEKGVMRKMEGELLEKVGKLA